MGNPVSIPIPCPHHPCPDLGIFYEYKVENSRLAFQSEIMYARQGGDVEFHNYEKDFNYKMEFAYQYMNIIGLAKWFPFEKKSALARALF